MSQRENNFSAIWMLYTALKRFSSTVLHGVFLALAKGSGQECPLHTCASMV
jgi:hypothetical protein